MCVATMSPTVLHAFRPSTVAAQNARRAMRFMHVHRATTPPRVHCLQREAREVMRSEHAAALAHPLFLLDHGRLRRCRSRRRRTDSTSGRAHPASWRADPTIFGTNKFSSLFGTSRFVRILFLVRLGGKAHADAALAVRYPIMSRWLVWKTSSLH